MLGKLNISMEAIMPLKLKTATSSFRHRTTESETNKIQETKHACIVEAHESTRKPLDRTQPKDYEDHSAEKGFNSLSPSNIVYKFVLMLQAMKILDAQAAVDKEWEKLEKLPAWQMTKVKSKTQVIQEAQRKKRKSSLLHY